MVEKGGRCNQIDRFSQGSNLQVDSDGAALTLMKVYISYGFLWECGVQEQNQDRKPAVPCLEGDVNEKFRKGRQLNKMKCGILRLCAALAVVWSGAGDVAAQAPLRVVAEDYPPYEMATPVDGLHGFDYEVAVEAFRRAGYGADIRFLPWMRVLNAAEKGSAVGILTCAYRKEREHFILFSDPISSFTSGFFYRASYQGSVPTALEDVIGRSVASVAGYQSLRQLQDIGADPVETPTTSSALRMLAAGRFDFFYAGREMTDYLIRQKGLDGEFRFKAIGKEDFHFCFSRAYPEVSTVVDRFNAALAEMFEDGSYLAIHAKYR